MFNYFDGSDQTLGLIDIGIGTSNPNRSYNPLDWNGIINRGFDLASQAFQSFGGRTVGTQTYGSGGQIFAINTQNQGGGYSGNPYGSMTAEQIAAYQRAQSRVGGTIGSGVDGIFDWLMENPLITFGGIAAIYLLMREPPRRRS